MLVSELKLGDRVIFESVPNGSYLSTDKVYEIANMGKREIYFRSQTGSGTSDTRRMLSMPNVSFYRATC
jgi:hypothetical protein